MKRHLPCLFALLLLLPEMAVGAAGAPRCETPEALLDLGQPLPRLASRIASGAPVIVVAIGSSSTSGAGASDKAKNYPAQLARLWRRHLGPAAVIVHNRGVGGETIDDMRKRLQKDVLALNPDLVLWQLGTNAVLRANGVAGYAEQVRRGIAELKAGGADLVLIDMQYAPKVLREPDHMAMTSLLAAAAREAGIGLFSRFAAMRHWQQSGQLRSEDMLAADGLHLNDTGYLCWARALARSLARAAAAKPPNSAVSGRK